MKKLFVYAGLACAAALSLTNCSKIDPQTPSSEGMPFEIIASTAETKTTNDGFTISWEAGDALNLFHAVDGTGEYGKNDKFDFAFGAKFNGNLTEPLESGKCYDWYALYPYNENISTPADKEGGYVQIGDASSYQKGYDNLTHLSGTHCPLYGVAKSAAADEAVKIEMNNLTSVAKIVITNGKDGNLKITSVSLTAEEDIVGSYSIDFTGSDVIYTPKSADKTVKMFVTNPTNLAKDKSASIYIPIKPFVAASGSTLKISIVGSFATSGSPLALPVSNYNKSLKLVKDVEFKAGKIKAVNFKYDGVEAWDGKTTTAPTAGEDGVYHIKTAAEFVGMLNDSRPYPEGHKYKNVVLDSDIDLGGHEIYGFGDGSGFFYGVFDGQNHTVKNFVINHTTFNEIGTGLFNYNANYDGGATIKNLKVTGAKVTGPKNVGVIAGGMYDGFTIENCHVSESVVYATEKRAGGIVGICQESTVKNCSVKNTEIYTASSGLSSENEDCAISGYTNNGGKEENNTSSNVTIVRNYQP